MVWRETGVMDERMRFVLAVEADEEPIAALCREFGISRRIGYKWLGRYRQAGVAGLEDRSRAPLRHRRRWRRRSPSAASRCGGRTRPGVR